MALAKRNGYTFASLFSGCGGFDFGFMQAGLRCIAAFDIDRVAIENHRRNLGAPATVCDLLNGIPVDHLDEVDVLIAGPPCQGFSLAGVRNVDDPRNRLLPLAAKLATQILPKVFVVENVAGVKAGSHKAYWDCLDHILRGAGYATHELICAGTDYGIPQLRKRCFFVAWRTGRNICEVGLHTPGGVLRDVLQDLKGTENHEPSWLEPESKLSAIAKHLQPGQKLCNVREGKRAVHTWNIPEVFGPTTPKERRILHALLRLRRRRRVRSTGDADPVPIEALRAELSFPVDSFLERLIRKGFVRRRGILFDLAHTFNGKFRRLDWNQPSYTVDTRFGDPRYFLHPAEQRGFSVREAARIQGFPDSFVFSGPIRTQFRVVGNAVPPPMSRALAEMIRRALLD